MNDLQTPDVQIDTGALEALTRGEIDIQIATAKRYPRSVKKFLEAALTMATLDEETASACFYVLPKRKGSEKPIEGPSVRLAEIAASAWGHMRVEGRVVAEDDRFITARGTAWDLESNVAIAFESRRRITTREGQRYSDDMINVTANAATSIAIRNSIFKVIPAAYTKQVYARCRQVAAGKIETLAKRRQEAIDYFGNMGIKPQRIFDLLDVKGIEDVTLDHLVTLKGLATAIREGDITITEAFAKEAPEIEMPRRKDPAPAPEGVDPTTGEIRESAPAAPDPSSQRPAEPATTGSAPKKAAAPSPAGPAEEKATSAGGSRGGTAAGKASSSPAPATASPSVTVITEDQRRQILGAVRKTRGDDAIKILKAHLADRYQIDSTKQLPVEKLAEVLAWAETPPTREREPGDDDA